MGKRGDRATVSSCFYQENQPDLVGSVRGKSQDTARVFAGIYSGNLSLAGAGVALLPAGCREAPCRGPREAARGTPAFHPVASAPSNRG